MKEVKKVLLINASPKKERSTTLNVSKAFVSGLEEVFDIKLDIINVFDLNIKPCLGCLSCWGRTEGECVIKDDDVIMVKNKIIDADIIIESFPLYFFGMPGILKLLTDRLLSMMNTYRGQIAPVDGKSFHGLRYYNENQKFIVFSSCAYTESDKIFEPLTKEFDCIFGKNGYLFFPLPQLMTLIDLKNQTKINKYLDNFRTAGKEFALNETVSEDLMNLLKKPPFSVGAYKIFLDNFWKEQKGER